MTQRNVEQVLEGQLDGFVQTELHNALIELQRNDMEPAGPFEVEVLYNGTPILEFEAELPTNGSSIFKWDKAEYTKAAAALTGKTNTGVQINITATGKKVTERSLTIDFTAMGAPARETASAD